MQHGGVAMQPLHGTASSMPAHGSARVVVDGEGGGGVRGKRASSSERARTEAERGHGDIQYLLLRFALNRDYCYGY